MDKVIWLTHLVETNNPTYGHDVRHVHEQLKSKGKEETCN